MTRKVEVSQNRADFDIKPLSSDATLEEVISKYNASMKYLSFFNKSLSLQSNFNCFMAENIVFQATGDSEGRDTQVIQHFLGVIPKWRIILRQVGNGVLEDIPSGWDSKVITLKNRGSEIVTATIMIVRE